MQYNACLYVEKNSKASDDAIHVVNVLKNQGILNCEITNIDDESSRSRIREKFGSVNLPILDVHYFTTFRGVDAMKAYFSSIKDE